MKTLERKVTLADVARSVGISKTTASHALSGKGWVSPSTRDAVQKAALELGFEVDPLARLLSNGRNETTVGFFTLDLDLSSRTRQVQIIQAELNDRGYSVPIYAYGYRGRDDVAHQTELMSNLLAQRPRAIVCNLSGVRPEAIEQLERYILRGGIAVCYGYDDDAPHFCDMVQFRQSDSFEIAARHLSELGHRTAGLFNVGQRTPAGETLRAFERGLVSHGARTQKEWLFANDGTHRYEEDGARLGEEFLKLNPRPTAMVVANDYAAAAFVAVLVQNGVRVPEDVSVVGRDDDAIAPYAVVPLTTVSCEHEEMAARIVEMLSKRLELESGAPRHIVIEGKLVVRSSTARI